MTDVAQEVEKEIFLQPLSSLIAKLSYSRRLGRAWRLIEENYTDPDLSLEQAARASGVSKNHLNVLCRRVTSFTFHQLLIRYRLLRAIGMMRSKNYSLLEIALQSGFGSLSAFERNFHKIAGHTPQQFRIKICI